MVDVRHGVAIVRGVSKTAAPKLSRTELLIAILAAFQGIKGNLTEKQADAAIAIVEEDFGGDLDKVAAHLRSEATVLELACKAAEQKPTPMADLLWSDS